MHVTVVELSTNRVAMVTDRRFLPHQLVPGCHSDAVFRDEEARDVSHVGGTEALPDVEQQYSGEQFRTRRMLRRTHQICIAYCSQGAPAAAAAGTSSGEELPTATGYTRTRGRRRVSAASSSSSTRG